jgi:hypothetical protein
MKTFTCLTRPVWLALSLWLSLVMVEVSVVVVLVVVVVVVWVEVVVVVFKAFMCWLRFFLSLRLAVFLFLAVIGVDGLVVVVVVG